MNQLLEINGLTKKYPQFELTDISFSLAEGRIMGLIGKNGAGKTTTLKSMLNMVHPDSGRIRILGRDFPAEEITCKQEIGVVLGGIDFYQHKKLSDITAVTSRFYKNWDNKVYRHYMNEFELDPKKRVNQLSQGMRVKYLIALALSHKARLLILDEPTSGLDPVSREDLLVLFQTIVKDNKRGILFSTHITSDLDKCADDITYIKDGRVLLTDEKERFIKSFQHLKTPKDTGDLSLEEIMVRTERRSYDV